MFRAQAEPAQDSILITIKKGTYTLKEIFSILTRHTGKQVAYATNVLDDQQRVVLARQLKGTANAILATVLPSVVKWTLSDDYITLYQDLPGPSTTQSGNVSSGITTVRGSVVDTAGNPLFLATIRIVGSTAGCKSSESGQFSIMTPEQHPVLLVSYYGYETRQVKVDNPDDVHIVLTPIMAELKTVNVLSDGYQKISPERATGAYTAISTELFNRNPSSSILERLDGIASGFVINRNPDGKNNQPSISIRGRSTIFANAEPLIVVDNFPYNGTLDNLNPNDIESVTILKDAAAASIWGARAGNGVIVITTKKGSKKDKLKLEFNSNISISEKPNLFYTPQMSVKDYIDAEKFLFNTGAYYLYMEQSPAYFVSPVVELLYKNKDKQISDAELNDALDKISKEDIRGDLKKYYYQSSVTQQYSLSASGGNAENQYYLSVGYNRNKESNKNYNTNVAKFTFNDNYSIIKDKLSVSGGMMYMENHGKATSPFTPQLPYGKLKNDDGTNAIVPGNWRQSYVDTIGGGRLLNWNYVPLDEQNMPYLTTKNVDLLLNIRVQYIVLPKLSVNLYYQYGNGATTTQIYNSPNSYYTRNLVNSYSYFDANGQTIRPIPTGGILDYLKYAYESNNIRGEIAYANNFGKFAVKGIAGVERRNLDAQLKPNDRLYGYNSGNSTSIPVDFTNSYTILPTPYQETRIPNNAFGIREESTYDNNLSYYGHLGLSYLNKYTFSSTLRRDESNLFGVNTNNKGVPLYALGFAWNLSNEKFFNISWVDRLNFKYSYGYSGNVDKTITAYTTAANTGSVSIFGQPSLYILNPPNANLRWEKIGMSNLGVEFSILSKRISGSFDYFKKNGKDLIGYGPLAPSTGNSTYKGNVANMKGAGYEISLNTLIINQKFKWNSIFLLSKATDRVTEYKAEATAVNNYMTQLGINPLVGKPVYSIFSYKWAGLNPETGDPQGIVNGKPSTDYAAITGTKDLSTLVYNGPANPVYIASIRNEFSYKNVELSFLITGKFLYFFRRTSVNYSTMLTADQRISPYNPDYSLRWQKPGDEKNTNVPSQTYPKSDARSALYQYSEILVEPGDHIRFQDINLSYSIQPKSSKLKVIKVYTYINNIGILYKKTHYNIDPDYVPGNYLRIPPIRTYNIGVKVFL
ncbi:SusC/RagA family TonB-linked outer membrane protein [Chitinophaga sp. Cy-1792]|uniref:SusC/RagA family TonB-linked outer membrane protein n=1 Tax=Chitinophaga sp. Cy-1792 TaxID=2608339 RepID=UPI00142048B4|nr:SusC/RagA family TonB-linked outer membrane protein [Chitinophaga sp. Cy-1792]